MAAPTLQRQVKQRVICGHNYRVTLLGAKQGRVMLVRLVKTFGPAVAAFLEGVLHAPGGLTESLTAGAADSIRNLTDKLSDKDLTEITDTLAHYTVVELAPDTQPQLDDVFDEHFAGRYDAYMQWLAFALEANFASFFGGSSSGGATALLEKLRILIRSVSPSPTASTGISTASPQAATTPTVS